MRVPFRRIWILVTIVVNVWMAFLVIRWLAHRQGVALGPPPDPARLRARPGEATRAPFAAGRRPPPPSSSTQPLSLVHQDGPATLYSRGVNRFRAMTRNGDEIWLATSGGVKRVRNTGRGGPPALRLYTESDGLPNGNVLAIGSGGDEVWCVTGGPAALRGGKVQVDFMICRYDPASDRWRTERRIQGIRSTFGPRSERHGSGPAWSISNQVTVAVGEALACFGIGESDAGQPRLRLLDRNTRTWSDVPLPAMANPLVRGQEPPFAITYLHTDRHGVWVATTQGLFRYFPATRTWRRFLDERTFAFGGANVDAMWLLGGQRISQGRDRAGRFDHGQWILTRIPAGDPGAEGAAEWDLPVERRPADSQNPFRFSQAEPLGLNVTHGQDAAWVATFSGHWPPGDRTVTFHHVQNRRLKSIVAAGPEALEGLSDDAVLPVVVPGPPSGGMLPYRLYPATEKRFAQWWHPDAGLPFDPTWTSYLPPLPEGLPWPGQQWRIEQDARGRWGVVCNEQAFYPAPSTTGDQVSLRALGATEGALWVLGSRHSENGGDAEQIVWRLRAEGKSDVHGSDLGLPRGFNTSLERLVSDGKSVWAVGSGSAYHFDERAGRWEDVAAELRQRSRNKPASLAVQDVVSDVHGRRYVWVTTQTFRDTTVTVRPGLNMGWRESDPFDLWRYDTQTKKWAPYPLPPPLREAGRTGGERLMAEPNAIWVTAGRAGVLRYRPSDGTWKQIRPAHIPDAGVRVVFRGSDGIVWFAGPGFAVRWDERAPSRAGVAQRRQPDAGRRLPHQVL